MRLSACRSLATPDSVHDSRGHQEERFSIHAPSRSPPQVVLPSMPFEDGAADRARRFDSARRDVILLRRAQRACVQPAGVRAARRRSARARVLARAGV